MFKFISGIKDVVTVVSIVATLGLGYWGNLQRQEAQRATDNLYSKTIQWEDEKGRLVTETTELRYTVSELKDISKRDKESLSEAERKVAEAAETIKELGIKARNVDRYENVSFEVADSAETKIVYRDKKLEKIEPIRTKHMDIDFIIKGDKVIAAYKYKGNVKVIINRKVDKETKKGKKRFFLARWVNPRYDYWSTVVSDDKNATITSTDSINFQKKKGKR